MNDSNGLKVIVEWMGNLDEKLDKIHSDLNKKADRDELQKVDEKANRAHKKINVISGGWAVLAAGVASFFGLKS
jgi:hypothetical protein